MFDIKNITVIQEFENDETVCGVYLVQAISSYGNEKKVFIRHGNSVSAITYYHDEPSFKCISEIRPDVRDDFLKRLSDNIGVWRMTCGEQVNDNG